jgi:hypothetical protein
MTFPHSDGHDALHNALTARRLLQTRLEERRLQDRLTRCVEDGADVGLRLAAISLLGQVPGSLDARAQRALLERARTAEHPLERQVAVRALVGAQVTRRGLRPPSPETLVGCEDLLQADPWVAVPAARALLAAGELEGQPLQGARALVLKASEGSAGAVAALGRTGAAQLQEDVLLALVALPRDPELVAALDEVLSRDAHPDAVLAAVAAAIDDPAWLAASGGETPFTVRWLQLLGANPTRALELLTDAKGGWESFQKVRALVEEGGPLEAQDRPLRGRGRIVEAIASLLRRLRAGALPEWALAEDAFAEFCLRLILSCGGVEAAAALDVYAEAPAEGQEELQAQAQRAAAVLRGRLPEAFRRARTAGRAYLRAHLDADGTVRADVGHPAAHPCADLAGRAAPSELSTPLALLALLPEPGDADLGPTARWLGDPAQDRLGWARAAGAEVGVPDRLVSAALAMGEVPRGLEEALIALALQRAAAADLAKDQALAAHARRSASLRGAAGEPHELPYLFFAQALTCGAPPAGHPTLAELPACWEVAASPWRGPPSRAAWDEFRGDPWLTTQALAPPAPRLSGAGRQWLWDVAEHVAEALAVTPPDGLCPGAILFDVHGGQDPVTSTALIVLTIDALEAASGLR